MIWVGVGSDLGGGRRGRSGLWQKPGIGSAVTWD